MKRFLATLALTCALSVPVLAGEIPTCGTEPATPDTTTEVIPGDMPTVESVTPGEIPTCGATLALLTVLDLVF